MKTIHTNIAEKNLENKKKRRAEIDVLRSRISMLERKDKQLMKMYLENGCSVFQISQITDLCETSIARRIKGLKQKLLKGEYVTCLRNRQKFNKEQMVIAKDYFLTGLSMREITIKRNRSLYSVRETIIKIKSILNECEYSNIK